MDTPLSEKIGVPSPMMPLDCRLGTIEVKSSIDVTPRFWSRSPLTALTETGTSEIRSALFWAVMMISSLATPSSADAEEASFVTEGAPGVEAASWA